MKKILLILLSCLMVIGLFGCGNRDEETDDASTQPVSEAPSPDDSEGEAESDAEEITVKINSVSENILIFGEREVHDENFLTCNYPGSGFEMKLNTVGGNIRVRIMTSDTCYFRVWVDGAAQKSTNGSEYFSIIGNKFIELTDIADGEHTLRVVRVSDGDVTAKVYAAMFKGEQLEFDNSDRYFIEFVGDENTSGDMLGEGRDDTSLAYSYLTANNVSADYAITAYAGAGLGENVTSNVFELYSTSGNFARKANMVVLNIGVADVKASTSTEDFKQEYQSLITSLKKNNGMACKIVCVITHENADYTQAIKDVCDSMGGESYAVFCFESGIKTNDKLTVDQHSILAEALSAYILQIKDIAIDMMIDTEASGVGTIIAHKSDEWTVIP